MTKKETANNAGLATATNETKTVMTFATTSDKGFNETFKQFNELVKQYANTSEIKANKASICETLNIDFKSYKMMLSEYRTNVLSNLTTEQISAKIAAKNFANALNAAFASAQTSEMFGSKIAKIRKDNKDFSVVQFVKDYYRYISVDGDILVMSSNFYKDKDNLLHKVSTLEAISEKQSTPAKAYSVICQCIDNYYLQAKNTFKNKDFALNRYKAGIIVQISEYNSKDSKFVKIDKLNLNGLQSVSFEDAKELRK